MITSYYYYIIWKFRLPDLTISPSGADTTFNGDIILGNSGYLRGNPGGVAVITADTQIFSKKGLIQTIILTFYRPACQVIFQNSRFITKPPYLHNVLDTMDLACTTDLFSV